MKLKPKYPTIKSARAAGIDVGKKIICGENPYRPVEILIVKAIRSFYAMNRYYELNDPCRDYVKKHQGCTYVMVCCENEEGEYYIKPADYCIPYNEQQPKKEEIIMKDNSVKTPAHKFVSVWDKQETKFCLEEVTVILYETKNCIVCVDSDYLHEFLKDSDFNAIVYPKKNVVLKEAQRTIEVNGAEQTVTQTQYEQIIAIINETSV